MLFYERDLGIRIVSRYKLRLYRVTICPKLRGSEPVDRLSPIYVRELSGSFRFNLDELR